LYSRSHNQEHQPPAAIGSSPDGNAGGGEIFVLQSSWQCAGLSATFEATLLRASTDARHILLTRWFKLTIPDSLTVKLAGRPRPSVPHPIATRAAAKMSALTEKVARARLGHIGGFVLWARLQQVARLAAKFGLAEATPNQGSIL
jgi:hypothetical protein